MARYRTEPKTCCLDCFAHPWLRDYIRDKSVDSGTCPVCRRRRKPLLPVGALYGPFENLLTFYKPAEGPPLEHGDPLIYLVQEDWEIFAERIVESDRAGILLESIMHTGWDDGDGEPPLGAADPYIRLTRKWSHDTLTDIWESFSERVKDDPTHMLEFGNPEFHDFLINEDLLGRMTAPVPPQTLLYRARLGFTDGSDGATQPYSGPAIGAPPPDEARAGRANRQGRAVLYCADQEQTAIAEVRPARGEYVSIAGFYVCRELSILDLGGEPTWPNPFTAESLPYEVEFAGLLYAFAEALSTPLRRQDDLVDYRPSQKLAELIERAGLDGVRYPSAMAPSGTNVVLFDPSSVRIGTSRLVEVADVQVQYRGLS